MVDLFPGLEPCDEKSVSPMQFDWELDFEKEPNALACAYWTSCCAGRPMPRRADLDPVAMRRFSGHIGLVEVRPTAEGVDYFIRRAGSRWEDVYGPMTGRYLHEFLPPHLIPSWREVFGTVRAARRPLGVKTRVDFQCKRWLSIEILVAPLGEGGEVTMLFVSFVAWTDAGLSPANRALSL